MRRDVALIPLYLWVSASICVHVASYFGSDVVADRAAADFRRRALAHAAETPVIPPSEIEFNYVPPPPPPTARPHTSPTDPEDDPDVAAEHSNIVTPPHRAARIVVAPTVPTANPTATPQVPHPPEPPHVAEIPRPPPPPMANRHIQMVDQQRENNDPAPDDPAFLAQSNNNVREQTQAAVRNLNQDHPDPQAGGTRSHTAAQTPGSGDRQVSADSRDVQGDRRHVPSTTQHPTERTPRPEHRVAMVNAPGHSERAGEQNASAAPGRVGRDGVAGTAGARGAPGSAEAVAATGIPSSVITGESGTIAVGEGAGVEGNSGANGQNGQGGHNGQGGQNGDAASRLGVRGLGAAGALAALSPSATTYNQVYGTEAEHERRVAQERRSQARGTYEDSWRENRAAMENYTPSVRIGNQTSLRTAASPFAGYITSMHRRIHRLFADGFIEGLTNLPASSPLNDQSLATTLEIVIENDGRIGRLGVFRTSGVSAFDVAALNSVRRAAPFGTAPENIRSGDGRVYVHWGFFRNELRCSPYNAEPYLIPSPGSPTPPAPNHAPPGRVPSDERGHPTAAPDSLGAIPTRRVPDGMALGHR